MKVKELMNTNLIKIDVNQPLRSAFELMKKHKISHLVVTRHGKIDGIVSFRDLLQRLGKETERKLSDAHIYVSSCYQKHIITIDKDADIREAAKLMMKYKISSLLVEDNKNIIGIITKTDLLRALKHVEPPVESIMRRNPAYLHPESRLVEARKIMIDENIKHLPIIKSGKVVGVVSEKDLVKALEIFRKTSEGKHWNKKIREIRLEKIMSTPPIVVTKETKISKAAKLMIESRIGCLPVVENDKLIGIVTKTDLISLLIQ